MGACNTKDKYPENMEQEMPINYQNSDSQQNLENIDYKNGLLNVTGYQNNKKNNRTHSQRTNSTKRSLQKNETIDSEYSKQLSLNQQILDSENQNQQSHQEDKQQSNIQSIYIDHLKEKQYQQRHYSDQTASYKNYNIKEPQFQDDQQNKLQQQEQQQYIFNQISIQQNQDQSNQNNNQFPPKNSNINNSRKISIFNHLNNREKQETITSQLHFTNNDVEFMTNTEIQDIDLEVYKELISTMEDKQNNLEQ
ncbi:hypothetical protein PPERSA_05748 [Pseudocohnilembus persalinus]|uniref:Uncharacterized protein n=1 Tax=Pseudocohnilembus persalinus TaxID=266149 RepID=A0A0V0QIQ6_PSEPJ|nr:hypothetical protein PPERSA_05748 [Pseudocohnilembus persalinus]|eukprot:KRX01909.1 hypothetical protein PPERSA_05748 [Pseudocohnilembus persalinus]